MYVHASYYIYNILYMHYYIVLLSSTAALTPTASTNHAQQHEFVARRCPFDTEDRQVEDGGALVQPIIGLDSLSPDHKPDPPARVAF